MTEENVPADEEAAPAAAPTDDEQGTPHQPSSPTQSSDDTSTDEEHSPPQADPVTDPEPPASTDPAPEEAAGDSSPWPWEPEEQDFPSPEEDAALAQERAKRFGSVAEDPPAAEDAGPDATQAFAPEAQPQPAPAPAVTPVPASPQGEAQAPVTPLPPTAFIPTDEHVADEFHELDDAPASRAAAHWWTVLISLVFTPVAWYLLSDAGARLVRAVALDNHISVATYIELGAGLVALFIFLLAARWSSVGSIIVGSIALAAAVAFLIFPVEGAQILHDSTRYFGRLGQFGINAVEHLRSTFHSGAMAAYGVVLIMVGVVSHGARRQGRREERAKIALGQ